VVVEQEVGREKRYHLLEMIRQYAHEKFIGTDEHQNIHSHHLDYFLDLSKRAEIEVRGPARVNWIERLNDERHNLRSALHRADQTNLEAGLYIAARLRRYWESSDLREGIHWLETFLSEPESINFLHARGHALHTYGWLLTWLQQFDKALSVTEESLTLLKATGDQHREADTLTSLANIRQFLDEPDAAVELLKESLVLAQSLNDPWREANVYFFLGWDRRDFQKSISYWEKSVLLYRQAGDQIALANVLGILGQFRVLNGDLELGEQYLDESVLLWEANHRANVWQNPKVAKSLVALTRGDHEHAYELLQESLQATKETGNRMSYLWVRVRLGYAALRSGRLEEARGIFAETARDFHKDGYTAGTVFTLEGIAAFLIVTGKPEKAARLIGCADATREKIRDIRPLIEEADMYRNMAAILSKIGPSGFEVTYDEGRSMTLEQAVELALRDG
jgi:tetratricopeptide (TPR) repeat protein